MLLLRSGFDKPLSVFKFFVQINKTVLFDVCQCENDLSHPVGIGFIGTNARIFEAAHNAESMQAAEQVPMRTVLFVLCLLRAGYTPLMLDSRTVRGGVM